MLNDDNQRGWFHLETNDFLNIVSFWSSFDLIWWKGFSEATNINHIHCWILSDLYWDEVNGSIKNPAKIHQTTSLKNISFLQSLPSFTKKKKSLQQSQSSTYQLESSKVGEQESLKSLAKNLSLARRLPIIVTSPDECEIAHKNQRGSLRISKPRPVESSVGWDRKASRNVEASLQIMEKPKKHPKATRWISNKFTISSWTLWPCQSRASETASRMY